jgi:membrane fusion protein, multidrug efflux system
MHISVVLDTRVAVAIPEEAIITESNTTYVYLISDNKAVRRDVTLGTRRDGTVEITSGMDAGETVISSGVQNVDDGRTIEIIEREISAPEQRPRTG